MGLHQPIKLMAIRYSVLKGALCSILLKMLKQNWSGFIAVFIAVFIPNPLNYRDIIHPVPDCTSFFVMSAYI